MLESLRHPAVTATFVLPAKAQADSDLFRTHTLCCAAADDADDNQARALKRPRLVWTAKLHQCFVTAVEQLGLKNAVPKTIMQARPQTSHAFHSPSPEPFAGPLPACSSRESAYFSWRTLGIGTSFVHDSACPGCSQSEVFLLHWAYVPAGHCYNRRLNSITLLPACKNQIKISQTPPFTSTP